MDGEAVMSSFRVRGTLDDTLYEVEVTGDPARPVVGSDRVAELVRQETGETVLATPQGPACTVDPGDATSVLALLSAQTKVESVGDMGQTVPSLIDRRPPGTVR